MALIFCPECGNQVSEHAIQCGNCSFPIASLKNIQSTNTTGASGLTNHQNKVVQPQKVNNTIVWFLAFAPLIGTFLQGFITGAIYGDDWYYYYDKFWLVTVVLNVILSSIDESKLKALGYDTDELGSNWLVPIYLYRRAKMLGHDQAYFWVWIVLFTLDFFSLL